MAKCKAPKNYTYDAGSGLYYREMRLENELGKPIRHMIWFNDETGEYIQKSYNLAPEKKKNNNIVSLAAYAGVAILVVFLLYSFAVKKDQVMNQEDLIQSAKITDDSGKRLSFQSYEAALNDSGVVVPTSDTQMILEDE